MNKKVIHLHDVRQAKHNLKPNQHVGAHPLPHAPLHPSDEIERHKIEANQKAHLQALTRSTAQKLMELGMLKGMGAPLSFQAAKENKNEG
jgi:hypothetical protein